MDGKRVILAAHRGDKFKCPENTMPAFRAAINFGVDMIETDIRMTKDGELVVIHDRSTLRTTGVDKNIDEMTLKEVKQLDAGAVFAPEFAGTTIPTVKEFLNLVVPSGILVNWELKVYPKDFNDKTAFRVADRLIALIEKYNMTERSMVNSFSIKVLNHIYQKHGHKFPIHGQGIYNCPRSNDKTDTPAEEIFDWCCLYPNTPGHSPVDFKENFDHCLKHQIHPCVCIPDTLQTYQKALSYGCKMFTSNNIYQAHQILKELGVR